MMIRAMFCKISQIDCIQENIGFETLTPKKSWSVEVDNSSDSPGQGDVE